MNRYRAQAGLQPALLLALLLVGAQYTALAHAYGHDTGALQNQSCATCVTAGQLGLGCIDALASEGIVQGGSCLHDPTDASRDSFHALIARQRGPPLTF